MVTGLSPAMTCWGITRNLSATHFGYHGPMLGNPRTVASTSLNLVADKYIASRIGCEIVKANDIETAPAASSASGRFLLFAISFHEEMLAATNTAEAAEVTASHRHGNCTALSFGRIS